MKTEEIIEQWETDSNICFVDISIETQKTTRLHSKYLRFLSYARQKLIIVRTEHDKMREMRFRYYTKKITPDELTKYKWDGYGGITPKATELSHLLSIDPIIRKCKEKIEYYEDMESVVVEIIKQINSRSFMIKNYIEFKRFQEGLN